MIRIVAISAIAIGLSSICAQAQSLSGSARSDSNSASEAAAMAAGGNVIIHPSPSNVRSHQTYGRQTIVNVPQVVAPSMSSGHPCAYAPHSIGISVVGFGGAYGGQRIDDACLLAQMGYRAPSVSMIAARNPQACRALEVTGTIPAGYCGGQRRVTYAQPQPRYVPKAGKAPVAAQRIAGGKQARIVRAGKATVFQQATGSNCRMVTPPTGRYKVQKCS